MIKIDFDIGPVTIAIKSPRIQPLAAVSIVFITKEAFFGFEDPIGKYIKIDNVKFRVIGVLEKQGKFLGLFSVDNQAILPLGAYKRFYSK